MIYGFFSNPIEIDLGILKTSQLPVVCNNFKYSCGCPWIKVTKFMTDHRRILWKRKPLIFTSCFNRANDGGKFYYCTSVSMIWCHGYRAYRGFGKQPPWRYWPKKFFILTRWGTIKTLMWTAGLWSTPFNLLAKDLQKTCWEIPKIELILCF